MNIVDFLIIAILIIYVFKGFKNGAIKELVEFVGGFIVIIIAYLVKNPLSVYMYEHLPFMKFDGILSGVSVLNIVVYELLSFLIVAAVLFAIYKLVLTLTNIVEMILKVTVILEIPSKIFGLLVGFIEGVAVVFVLLFIAMQFSQTKPYVDGSKFGNVILTNTPILSNVTSNVYTSLHEIYDVAEKYKDSENKDEVNLQALDILLKYKMIDPYNAENLVLEGKLVIPGAEEVISKYFTTTTA